MSTQWAVDKFEREVDKLIASHSESRSVTDFPAKYGARPGDSLDDELSRCLEFMTVELGFTPYDKQRDVIASFLGSKRTVVRGCHGAGKDAVLGALILYAAYVRGMLVICLSATEKQLLNQLWREVGNRFSARLPGDLYTADLRIDGKKRVVAMTAGTGAVSHLTGWHDPQGVFVAVSESQAESVGDAAFDAAETNTIDDRSKIVVVGNPVVPAGRYYQIHKKPSWAQVKISAFDHPNVKEGRGNVVPGGPSPSWPAEMAGEYGTDSAFYVSRVLADFPEEGTTDALVPRAWIEAAFARHDEGVKLIRYPRPVLALDVARSTERDESVVALCQGHVVHWLKGWRVRDLVETSERFLSIAERARYDWHLAQNNATAIENDVTRDTDKLGEWLRNTGVASFDMWVDAPGIGSGCTDILRSRGRSPIEYWGWSPARDEKRYANKRAEVYFGLRGGLEKGLAVLPRDPQVLEELTAIQWSLDTKGRIILEAKEDLRKRLTRSPDRSDAVTIAYGAATGALRGPTVRFDTVAA